ncbi:MAG: response regulator transcription factor [Candidatus Dormibacteraceae bacterium]
MTGADRVLIVEDDEGIREALKYSLEGAGYAVSEASDGAAGLRMAQQLRPDLVLLDLMLPQMGGIEVCRALQMTTGVPVIMLTAKDSEFDKVVGLEVGADDYVTKPFSVREVLARVGAVIRRSRSRSTERGLPEYEKIGNFVIDRAAQRVLVDEIEVRLTAREFELLSYLLGHPGRVQTRAVLVNRVWGAGFGGDPKTVDVHIRWLREKLAGRVPFAIVTVRGSGYRLDRPPDGALLGA